MKRGTGLFFIAKDDYGNKLLAENREGAQAFFLELSSEPGRRRLLGTYSSASRTLSVRRIREKHLYQRLSAYGFNSWLLSKHGNIDTLVIQDNHGKYAVPMAVVMRKAVYLNYARSGFEKQLFLKLADIEAYNKLTQSPK